VASGEIEGTVMALQDEDLVLDLGSARGAFDGAEVEIWRPIKLKHPVTGKVLTDRFRIGVLELQQVRSAMSLARVKGSLSRPAAVGDVVLMNARPVTPPSPESPRAEEPSSDPEAQAITALFDGLRGADPVKRIRAYEDYIRAHPNGRFARVLYEEAAALRELVSPSRKKAIKIEDEAPSARNFTHPPEAVEGSPIRLAIEMSPSTRGAVLHVRPAGASVYASFPMTPAGEGYFAAQIPAEKVVAPRIEYFIEATSVMGKTASVIGSSSSPEKLTVNEVPKPAAPSRPMGMVQVLTDYADYNRFRNNDRVWQTEGFVGVRYGDTGVRALRLGFGVYRGVGGSIEDLDEKNLKPRSVGLTYGYLETEIGIVRIFSILGRVAVGLLDQGIGGGGQALVRIGNDLKTNLLLGGELLGGVGLRGITQLELRVFERFPILVRTEVSNQPAGSSSKAGAVPGISTGNGQVGGRGIVQLGFNITQGLMIAVRGSFEGRTIRHAGPGFGGAVGYTW
jgi:hypothetical protein